MKPRKFQKLIMALLLLGSATMITMAVAEIKYGQINGVITDAETKEPLVGVSVQIVGTDKGAMTDDRGKYAIRLVLPGTYDLLVTSIGYSTRTIKDIVVSAELSTECNTEISTDSSALEGIEVCAVRLIDKFHTTSMAAITQKTILSRPIKKSSTRRMTIRGGRAGEIAYIVDGVTIRDPQSGPGPIIGNKTLPLSHGGTAIVNGEPFDAMFFKNHGINPFVDVEDDSLSTFAFDIDDASFTLARNYLNSNALPNEDAIRTEEFVNHFKYGYQSTSNRPFSIIATGAVSRCQRNSIKLRIGVKGRDIAPENRKAANLTFVIDVSGSMSSGNRLELVKRALNLLVNELKANDKVGIVVYGSYAHTVLEPTTISQRDLILSAIAALHTEGATNAEAGIRLGYQMANNAFEKGKINRVILCSDGVANVGTTGPDGLLAQIHQYAKVGITLSTVGFGMGNYNDVLMEKLGDKGDGHYAYVDDISAARKIFVDNLTGTLQVIARDVKAQMVFNPQVVRSYRLLGYENRDVADQDFRVDTVDGGEVGSGHEVTVLYEIKLQDGYMFAGDTFAPDELGELYLRYKSPEGDKVTELKRPINLTCITRSFTATPPDFRLAVCAANYAEILRNSYWAREYDLADELHAAQALYRETGDKDIKELSEMIGKTIALQAGLANK